MSTNAFLQPRSFYNRDINPLMHYVSQMATALSIANNVPLAEAKVFIQSAMKTGKFKNLRDPEVVFFGKDENGDRTREEMPLSHYIRDSVQKKQIMVPTFTTYAHPDEDRSPISSFMKFNVSKRNDAKQASQRAEAAGNVETAFLENVNQANKKENNNSMSGAMATESSIFENDTGHNTLTSITRSMASIGNAMNERMIGGNRHYRNKEIALNNAIAIVHTMDSDSMLEAMNTFGLYYPTPQDLLKVFKHSMRYYVFDQKAYKDIYEFACLLSPLQRAAIVYNQDFYHIRQFNPKVVKQMLEDFAELDDVTVNENPIAIIKAADPLSANYAHQVCIELVSGLGKDYADMPERTVQTVSNVCRNIDNRVVQYRTLINSFFLTKTVPNSTAYIQDMVRGTVPLSDTDSTMFSVDEWVNWYFGKLVFTQRAYGIAGGVAYLAVQCIAHCLAIMSGNMGVADEHLFTLSMKPEFVFPVFVQSPVAKHYFTAMLVKEGAVYKDIKMEIKGVHNKNSALPGSIVEPAQARMEEIIRTVMHGEQISLEKEIKDVADIERTIINSLKSSEVEYLKRGNIKEASAYGSSAEESPYAIHTQWMRVWAPSYGNIEPPPYETIKIPTTLISASKFKKWLESMEDRQLAARMTQFSIDFNKKQLPTFYLSLDLMLSQPIPKEIIDVIDYRRIVLDLTNVRRMLLDSLGFPVRKDFLLSELGY